MKALLFFLFSLTSASAQDPVPLPGGPSVSGEEPSFEWQWGGYFEDTLNLEYLEAESGVATLNAARGRLNLSGEYKSLFDFGASVVGILYSGRTEIDTVQYFPNRDQDRIVPPHGGNGAPGAREAFNYEIDNRLYFQEAFGTLYLPGFRVRAGRHKFYSGTGYAFNPIDLFNRKDPLDPTYEIDGLDAILAAVELPRQTEIQGVVRWVNDFSHADYQVRMETYSRGFDIGLQYTRHWRERLDWETVNGEDAIEYLMQGGSTEPYVRRWRWNLVAGEAAGELGGVGVHGEGGYVLVEEPDAVGSLERAAEDHVRFLVGLDYTFESQWYVLAEYMHLGQGVSGKESIDINDRMAFLTGETLAAGKDTFFLRASYPLTDLTEFSVNTIVNSNDPSAIINPWLLFDLHPRVKLWTTVYFPIGDELGQLGKLGVSGFVRLKIHF